MVRIIVYPDNLPTHTAAALMNAVALGARGRLEAMANADEVVVVLKQRDPSRALADGIVQVNLEGELLTGSVGYSDSAAAKVAAIYRALRRS